MKASPVFSLPLLLLLGAAAAPASALSLGLLPAQPVEDAPFILVVSINAACPVPASIAVTPSFPVSVVSVVQVNFVEACSTPPQPRLVEVPLGPLPAGRWLLRARFGSVQTELQTEIQRVPYRIELDPPSPRAGSPITLRFAGNGSCPEIFFDEPRDGNLLTLPFDDECGILPPAGIERPFVIEHDIAPLPAGDYVVQVVSLDDRLLASHRFHVFAATECVPSDTALCLQRGRFRVSATWRTASAQGAAKVRPETADSGSLWFFVPDNLELLVKVLDACQNPDPKYWVFAAGLTNVEVDIAVTDTATQTTRRYRNALNHSFTPVLDTAAFECAPPSV
jgi:hypothetical protein